MKIFRFIRHNWGLLLVVVLIEWGLISAFKWAQTLGYDLIAAFFILLILLASAAFFPRIIDIWKNLDEHIKRSEDLKKRWAEQDEERRQAEVERCEMMRKLDAGEWTISALDFYKTLRHSKIQSLKTEFAIQKAVAVAREMLKKADVPLKYHNAYLSEEKLKELFSAGRKESARLSKEAKEAALIEEERKRTTPVEGQPTKEEQETIAFVHRTYTLTGLKKREKMLSDTLIPYKEELNSIKQKLYNLRNPDYSGVVSMTTHLINASQEKTHDWGLVGGIASGIAGPAAGALAASEVMAENARIKKKNEAVREHYVNMAGKIMSTDHTSEIAKYEKEYKRVSDKVKTLEAELNELPLKVVFKVDRCILQEYIRISDVDIQPTSSGILEVSMCLENNYVADVPANVSVVLDGTVKVDIFCDEVRVGTAYALLPVYGLEKGKPTLLHAFCTKHLEGTRNYSAKVSFLNLWAMEQ